MTHAPLPTWRTLVTALMISTLPDNELSASWRCSGDVAFWFSRSSWSLVAIAQWRQRITGQTSVTVWLPDFFCNASLFPLRSIGAQLQFYPLTDQMVPDLDACRTLVGEKRPDLFVLVHFFGQPALADGATALCRETGAWLIEDAAHVLRPITGVGEYGDCVLYSPHKHLPIPDGAVMVVREHGPARLAGPSELAALQGVYSSLLNIPVFSNQSAWFWLVKRILQRLGIRAWRRPTTPFLMNIDTVSTHPRLEHPKISPLARRLLSGLLESLDTVTYLRRQNRKLWDQVLAKADPMPAQIIPISGECTPYLAGFAFDDEMQAEKVFLQWQRAGLPVTTWPDLPPEVLAREVRYCKALKFRNTRVYLPIHQTLKPLQITAYGQRISIITGLKSLDRLSSHHENSHT